MKPETKDEYEAELKQIRRNVSFRVVKKRVFRLPSRHGPQSKNSQR